MRKFLGVLDYPRINHLQQMRGESRYVTNIADGLSFLDYKSFLFPLSDDIQRDNFSFIRSLNDKYDYALGFDAYAHLGRAIADKKFCMVYGKQQINDFLSFKGNNDNIFLCTSLKKTYDNIKTNYYKDILFLPVPFPSPTLQRGFSPITSLDKKQLNIYVQIHVFEGNTHIQYHRVVSDICYLLSSKFEVNLIVHTNAAHIETFKQTNTRFKGNISYINYPLSYLDLHTVIKNCDIGICSIDCGSTQCSQFDFISQGKPVIFVSLDTIPDGIGYISPFLDKKELIFDLKNNQYKEQELQKYLDWFLDNYEFIYNSYKDIISYYDFNNWKDIILNTKELN
jgi:hypothetical protein